MNYDEEHSDTERQLDEDEEHPCKCDEKHVRLHKEEWRHIKRQWFTRYRFFSCINCHCTWKKEEEYVMPSNCILTIVREPIPAEGLWNCPICSNVANGDECGCGMPRRFALE